MIWASKQYLGQSDSVDLNINKSNDDTVKEMESYFEDRAKADS